MISVNLIGWLLLAFLTFLVTYLGIKGFKLAEEDNKRLRDKSRYSRRTVEGKGEDFKERIVETLRRERLVMSIEGKPITPPQEIARGSRLTPAERTSKERQARETYDRGTQTSSHYRSRHASPDDFIMNPFHPLSPLNPAYQDDTPSRSYEPPSRSYDDDSCHSSSWGSSSSSCDSGSSYDSGSSSSGSDW